MNYTDNPRKIYGKEEITYSDADISRDIVVTTSGDAEISHPEEVIATDGYPTVKACTMDGNATMDGTFEMMDDSVRCGWWSNTHAGSTGTFGTIPTIRIDFTARPIRDWVVKGDEKLGQYPVDFNLKYLRNGTVIGTRTVRGNTQLRRVESINVDDITSIILEIVKWSAPNACAKLLQDYEPLTEVYEGDALQMFEITEELCNEEGNYNINSDSMSVTIYNEDRKFDQGYLRELTVLDRKLKPSIGIEVNGTVQWLELGTYYSDEWKIGQDTQWVKCSAVDRLMRMQNKVYVGLPLSYDISLYDITVDIFEKIGVLKDEYRISEELRNVVVPTAFMPKQSAWDALQEIANAGLCHIYVDRDDKIIVRSELEAPTPSTVTIGPSNMFTYVSNVSLTEYANRVAVEYCQVDVTETEVEAAMLEVTLQPEQSLEILLDYTTEIAYGFPICTNNNIELMDFNGGVTACTVRAVNTSNAVQSGTISVFGDAIEINTKTISVQDKGSVAKGGLVEYTHPASELVQSQEQAEWIGQTLLARLGAGKGTIKVDWRGDPKLELGNSYAQTDRFGTNLRLVCESNKYTYDGGLKQETRGRKV